MAEPLLSLLTPGTMKHVVPWKTREDFLCVYQDLYSDSVKSQASAIGRMLAWKSRAGSKMSVAIESTANLMQVRILHSQAERNGTLRQMEHQLSSSYSLALIRFVNHMTEKAQTKAVAQPVHLVAREFGIPEWIVRLRHDATHSALPCLDVLASGSKWALDYLQYNFWEQQRSNIHTSPNNDDNSRDDTGTSAGKQEKSPKTADIRRAFYEFQKIRYQRCDSSGKTKAESDHTAILGKLQKFMSQNKMKFVKCLLEDGILLATEEQLLAFNIEPTDLLEASPPTIPQQMALFWRPLLKRVCNAGVLPLFLHTAMFSVTSDQGLRNYQLVAWIAFILANTSSSELIDHGRRKRHGKQDCFMRTSQPIATRTLFSACTQNLNTLTAHLLGYLIDPDNLGRQVYDNLREQLLVERQSPQLTEASRVTDNSSEPADSTLSSSGSDSDNVDSFKESKCTNVEKERCTLTKISTNLVEDIKKTVKCGHISWKLCADAVDWSTLPLGMLPDQFTDTTEFSSDDGDDIDDHDGASRSGNQGRHQRRSKRRGNDDEDDDEEDESDDAEQHTSPKQCKLIVTDEVLI
ncbi:hypothetical protein RRG08_002806 [Elysia crispata]|uniref:Las1-like protein n=1 Tax=Elysia crispata TaxID=231223 RepID=A0AAE0XV14_9GAST|nr:hypothetical protein RRG08_002806 [Elysia crispata]